MEGNEGQQVSEPNKGTLDHLSAIERLIVSANAELLSVPAHGAREAISDLRDALQIIQILKSSGGKLPWTTLSL
jgi:hypothetical protein